MSFFTRVRRRWWLLLLVLVLAVAGTWFWLGRSDEAAAQRITATVERGTYKTTVTGSGTITPKSEADLSFSSSGSVTEVAVAVGDKVAKGDVLARIDSTSLSAQRDAAQAQVDAAESQASGDGDSSATQRASNDASLASARSQLAEAQDALDAATLRAPFAGTVSVVGFEVGDQAGPSQGAAADQSTPAITVISPGKLLVEAKVSAADVSKLKKGMQVAVTPSGGGDEAYGTVSSVGVIAEASESGAAEFPVTVAVTGDGKGLYAGATATVAITVKQATDILAVPTQALHTSGDTAFVYTVVDGKRKKTPVKIGAAYGMQTEVLSGVKEGAVVELASFTRSGGGGGNRGQGGNIQLPSGGMPMPSGGEGPPQIFQQGGGQ